MTTEKRTPLISIIMPAYNAEKHIEEAIYSILIQTYSNFELIIINDGSTDKTQEIIDKYTKKDSRIKTMKQKNAGVVAAANRAASLAHGEYITRHDADDISFPTKLSDYLATLEKEPSAVLVSGNIEVINDSGEFIYKDYIPPTDEDIKRALLIYNPLANGATLIKKSFFDKVGGYSDVFAEDLDLWIKLYDKGRFVSTGTFVYRWRISPNGLTSSNSDKTINIEREYTSRLWDTRSKEPVARNNIKENCKRLLEHKDGIHHKFMYLYTLSRIGTREIKNGEYKNGVMRLLLIMSTGLAGFKIATKQIYLSAKGLATESNQTKNAL